MFNCPYYPEEFNNYRAPITPPLLSFIRIFHSVPDASPVDIYANGALIARNLPYKSFTKYIPVPPGEYNIKIFPTGKIRNPIVDTIFDVTPRIIFTIAAVGRISRVSLLPIYEPYSTLNPGMVLVKFAHLSPNAPPVDITLPGGKKLFKDIEFKEVSGYIPIKPGVYTFQVRPNGIDKVVLNIPNLLFKANRLYTIYAVGLIGETPPLEAIQALDGTSYIKIK